MFLCQQRDNRLSESRYGASDAVAAGNCMVQTPVSAYVFHQMCSMQDVHTCEASVCIYVGSCMTILCIVTSTATLPRGTNVPKGNAECNLQASKCSIHIETGSCMVYTLVSAYMFHQKCSMQEVHTCEASV